jgi:hypothetical protein
MNGAIAEPLPSTTTPPNTAVNIKIGSSQNFLRTRMNSQSSARKDTMRRAQNWCFMVSEAGAVGSRRIQ